MRRLILLFLVLFMFITGMSLLSCKGDSKEFNHEIKVTVEINDTTQCRALDSLTKQIKELVKVQKERNKTYYKNRIYD